MKDLEVLREFYKSLEFKDGIKHTIVEQPNGFDVEYSIEGNDNVKRVDHITLLTGTTTDGEKANCIQFQDEITKTFIHDGEEIKTRQLGLIESFQEINPDYLDADHFVYLVENVLNSQKDTLRVSVDGTLTHNKLDLVNKIKTHMTGALISFFKVYENPFKHFVVVVGEKDVSIYADDGKDVQFSKIYLDPNGAVEELVNMVTARISELFQKTIGYIDYPAIYAKATAVSNIELIKEDKVYLAERHGLGHGLSRRLEVNETGDLVVYYSLSSGEDEVESSSTTICSGNSTFFEKLIAIHSAGFKVKSDLKDCYVNDFRAIYTIDPIEAFLKAVDLDEEYDIVPCNGEYLVRLHSGLFLRVEGYPRSDKDQVKGAKCVLAGFCDVKGQNRPVKVEIFHVNETFKEDVKAFIDKLEGWYTTIGNHSFKNLLSVGMTDFGERLAGKDEGKQCMTVTVGLFNDYGKISITESIGYFSVTRSYDIDLDKSLLSYIEAYDDLDYYYRAQDKLIAQAQAEGLPVPTVFKDENTGTNQA